MWEQWYERGVAKAPVSRVGDSDKRGTKVHFKPDAEIFPNPEFKLEILTKRFREMAFLNPGLRIDIFDERTGHNETYDYPGGIKSFVDHLNAAARLFTRT